MTNGLHARWSPSGSPRWLKCSATVTLGPGEDSTSPAAERGTLLHNLAADILQDKPTAPAEWEDMDAIVEADLSRPVRKYGIRESFASGDRISHKKLGEGVVQGVVGRGKIAVLFGEDKDKTLLVHERE